LLHRHSQNVVEAEQPDESVVLTDHDQPASPSPRHDGDRILYLD
jgi:hypothetical protein